ncbi:YbaB/EbfC family nucleoid-associated protein [Nocardioidaceae bacterium]|nr:YbaB/EbfC family nucleoid-associated protein [Nocardioidaceae bacterium]
MSENPFGSVDMGALLRQAQEMQQQLVDAQASLADEVVEGSVAGGAVVVALTGTGDLTDVRITPAALGDGAPSEDSLADLGDLVVAAWRDAKAASDRLAQERLGPLAAAAGMGGGPGVGGDAFGAGGGMPDLGDLGGLLGGGEPPRA